MLAQLSPASKNTPELLYSPGTDEEVNIEVIQVANFNNKDTEFVLYVDDDGTTYNDSTSVAIGKTKKETSDIAIDKTFPMNDSSGSIGIEVSDTDCTITVWGTVTDLS